MPRVPRTIFEARGLGPRASMLFRRHSRGGFRPRPALVALTLVVLLVVLAAPLPATAQTVQPVIAEHHGKKTQAKFELVNNGLVPLNVVIEPKSFDVSIDGEVTYRPLDSSVHLKLSAMSLRIPARQSRYVFYEASADSYPAWFVIPCTF
jgi:hypothetical protein